MKEEKIKALELHYFSDASQTGYGVAVYLRVVYENIAPHVKFVLGKARVTPLNRKITIPRLELSAAVVSARLSSYLQRELRCGMTKQFFWVDSNVVLGYINNETKRFHTYVANRAQTIRDLTDINQWRYIRSEDNPSDDGSRGLTAKKLSLNSRWINGPPFLWEKEFVPQVDQDICYEASDVADIKKEMKSNVTSLLTKAKEDDGILKRFERFSCWYKATRAAANCLRF
ncbi:uncharacterized protein LOC117105949 [Anneissia japonica]|uniref:uncharacterized protein LOC117105949 n=1 Tax=Anneissia japonica TaxID=1529436 RepID=UPI001425AFF9|nr:uncharacterized protein LOC117105949 [Anneissia japonica]